MDPILFDKVSKSRLTRLSQSIRLIPGLVAYYPLNEPSGNIAYNRAPATVGTYDATVSGPTQNAAGKYGPAYSFDGVNDIITDSLDLPHTAFSIFFIFKSPFTTSADNVRGILNKRENSNEW